MLLNFIVIAFILFFVTVLSSSNTKIHKGANLIGFFILSTFMSYIVSQRLISGDTGRYENSFQYICNYQYVHSSVGFQYFNEMFCEMSYRTLLFFIPLVAYISYLFHVSRKEVSLLYIYFFLITFNIVFMQYVASGLRQSLSMSFLLISIGFLIKEKRLFAITSSFIAVSFHWATLPFIFVVLLLGYFHKGITNRSILIFWVASCLISLFGITGYISPYLESVIGIKEITAVYFLSDTSFYKTGFRLDFFLFSLIPVFICYFGYKTSATDSEHYLLKFYLAFNGIAMLLNFIPFSDRIYGYSWFLVPIFIMKYIFYLLSNNNNSYITYVISLYAVIGYCFISFNYNFRFVLL